MNTGSLKRLAIRNAVRDTAWPVLPLVVIDCATGEILEISEAVATLFGYTDAELIGQTVETLVPEPLRTQHSSWRRDVRTPRARMMGEGRQVMGQRKDGTMFPCHVGLTSVHYQELVLGIGFVVDLTGVTLGKTPPGLPPDQQTPPPSPD